MLSHLDFDFLSDMSTPILPLLIHRTEYVVPFAFWLSEYHIPLLAADSSRERIGIWTLKFKRILCRWCAATTHEFSSLFYFHIWPFKCLCRQTIFSHNHKSSSQILGTTSASLIKETGPRHESFVQSKGGMGPTIPPHLFFRKKRAWSWNVVISYWLAAKGESSIFLFAHFSFVSLQYMT